VAMRYVRVDGRLCREVVETVKVGTLTARRVQRVPLDVLDDVEQALDTLLRDGEVAVAKRDVRGRDGFVIVAGGQPIAWLTVTPSDDE